MSRLSALASKAAALALLAALLVLVALLFVAPLLDRARNTREALELNEKIIARLTASLGSRETFEERIAELTRRIDRSGLYIRAATDALATALMQERLKGAIATHGGDLRSIQSLPSQTEDGLTRVGLRVVMSGDIDTLVPLLHTIETTEPYLFIDTLQISANSNRRRIVQNDEDHTLSLHFDVFGYLLPRGEG